MRNLYTLLFLLTIAAPTLATPGVDVTMPLVEETIRFLTSNSLDQPGESQLMRAGVIQICGEKLDRPGCKPVGVDIPAPDAISPEATDAWRQILESALAAEIIRKGKEFDKVAFQRYVMNAMVESIADPNSFYLIPAVYKKIASIPSDFVGFGLQISAQPQTILITGVHPDSPAANVVRAGDVITHVNGQPVTNYHRPMALAAIWGAYGKTLKLSIKTPDGSLEKQIDYAPWTFVPHQVTTNDEVVTVRVHYFGQGLVNQVREALTDKTKGIIIDIRGATAGDTGEMVGLADLLLSDGAIGSQKTRTDLGCRKWSAAAASKAERPLLKAALIINKGTGGMGVVFAAAMRKHNRAILIGSSTEGRTTQETIRPFSDGSAVQVTSTRLLGPGETRLGAGVAPHLKSSRTDLHSLAKLTLELAQGPSMDQLIKAAALAVKQRVKHDDNQQ